MHITPILHRRENLRHLTPLALVVAIVASFGAWASPADAKLVTLSASANLRITTSHGNRLEAQGPISGTFAGSLSIRVSLNSGSRMTATFVGYSHAGNLTGSVSAEYYPSGRVTIYSGSVGIAGGTKTYAHARAGGIHVEGELNRSRHLITLRITGRLSE